MFSGETHRLACGRNRLPPVLNEHVLAHFQQMQILASNRCVHLGAIQKPQVHPACGTPAEDEAFTAFPLHLVKKPEAHDFIGRLVTLPDASLQDAVLMYPAVVASHLFLAVHSAIRFGIGIATYAPCVYIVVFRQAVLYTNALCNVAIGQMHVWINHLQFIVKYPSHDAHECCIPEGHPSVYGLWQFYCPVVIACMAGLTQRNQVIGCIAASLSAFDMMNVQNLVS